MRYRRQDGSGKGLVNLGMDLDLFLGLVLLDWHCLASWLEPNHFISRAPR
jgi:hypothetical protein